MARRRRGNSRPDPYRNYRTTRPVRRRFNHPRVVNIPNANPRLRWLSPVRVPSLPMIEIEDRRQFHPSGPYRSARSMTGASHHYLQSVPSPFSGVPIGVGFENPRRLSICIRRKQRREVLLAKGRGGGGNRRPRWSHYSSVRC